MDVIKSISKNFSINFIFFTVVLCLKRNFYPSLLFYDGIYCLLFSTFILFLIQKRSEVKKNKVENVYSLIVSFFIVLTFHTTVVTIVDRSISIFILDRVHNGINSKNIIKKNFSENFTEYGIEKRILEQEKIKNLITSSDNIYLTNKGKYYYNFFRIILLIYRTDKKIISTE